MEAKPGFLERVEALRLTWKQAEQIKNLTIPRYDPWKVYKENENTQKFFLEKQGYLERVEALRLARDREETTNKWTKKDNDP